MKSIREALMKTPIVILLFVAIAMCAMSASNFVREGDVIPLTWSSASPNAGDPVVKATSKANGAIIGVALNGTSVEGETVSVKTNGVFTLSVTASSTVGNIVVGDYIYTTVVNANTCTCDLSNVNTGILFGKALEAITATSTAGVYQEIKVLLCQPAHL